MSETMAKHWMEKYRAASLENAKLRAAISEAVTELAGSEANWRGVNDIAAAQVLYTKFCTVSTVLLTYKVR